jgi:hypothetical protein
MCAMLALLYTPLYNKYDKPVVTRLAAAALLLAGLLKLGADACSFPMISCFIGSEMLRCLMEVHSLRRMEMVLTAAWKKALI